MRGRRSLMDWRIDLVHGDNAWMVATFRRMRVVDIFCGEKQISLVARTFDGLSRTNLGSMDRPRPHQMPELCRYR